MCLNGYLSRLYDFDILLFVTAMFTVCRIKLGSRQENSHNLNLSLYIYKQVGEKAGPCFRKLLFFQLELRKTLGFPFQKEG